MLYALTCHSCFAAAVISYWFEQALEQSVNFTAFFFLFSFPLINAHMTRIVLNRSVRSLCIGPDLIKH